MFEIDPLQPDNEYLMTALAVREVANDLIDQSAVYVGSTALTAYWIGTPTPRSHELPDDLDDAVLKLELTMYMHEGIVTVDAELATGGLVHTRQYRLDPHRMPGNLDMATAEADEQIRVVLGRGMEFSPADAEDWGDAAFNITDRPRQDM